MIHGIYDGELYYYYQISKYNTVHLIMVKYFNNAKLECYINYRLNFD